MARYLVGEPFNPPPNVTYFQYLFSNLSANPDGIVLVDTKDGREYTYREVHEKASSVAAALKEHGIGHEDIVLLIGCNEADAQIVTLGIWLAGATSSGINPALPKEELADFIKVCKSRVVYVGSEFLDHALEVRTLGLNPTFITPNGKAPLVDLHQIYKQPAPLVTHVDEPRGKDHVMAVLFTSGTTGSPKGVEIRDEALLHFALSNGRWIHGTRYLNSSPLYWISNLINLVLALNSGNTMIIADRASPERLLQITHEYKPNTWFSGPSNLLDMVKVPGRERYDLSSLSSVLVGGSAIFPEQRKMINDELLPGDVRMVVMYGATEGGLITASSHETDPNSPEFASVGSAAQGVTIKIVDPDTGELLPPNVPGEMCVKSPSVIKNYINKKITEKELDRDGFWHLGDIGHYDENGFVYYHTRSKDMMKFRGYQITPAELENLMIKHPEVDEVAVVGRPHPVDGEHPAAFVVLQPGSNLTQQQLDEYVSNQVVKEKKLRGGIYFVDKLPKNNVGKILRTELLKTFKD